jgi:V/A-type H+-transporting ATPase subunit A
VREDFLQQDGFHEIDAYCSMSKAYGIMRMVMAFGREAEGALKEGVPIDEIIQNPVLEKIGRARYTAEDRFQSYLEEVLAEIPQAFNPSS